MEMNLSKHIEEYSKSDLKDRIRITTSDIGLLERLHHVPSSTHRPRYRRES